MEQLSRRGFLRMFGAAAAAAAAPTYLLPPIGGWKSDVIHAEIGSYSTYLVAADSVLTGHFEALVQDDVVSRKKTDYSFRCQMAVGPDLARMLISLSKDRKLQTAISGTRVDFDAATAVMGLPANIWKR